MRVLRDRITAEARRLRESTADYGALVNELRCAFEQISVNTIHGAVWDLDGRFRKRGTHLSAASASLAEEDFYQLFADWLVYDSRDCTIAVPLGGSRLTDPFGTPDVYGIVVDWKASGAYGDIVSAEIKVSARSLMRGIGQALSYKLFSHKSYLVIPRPTREELAVHAELMAHRAGVGLVVFNHKDVDAPQFELKVAPEREEPPLLDFFYANPIPYRYKHRALIAARLRICASYTQ